MMKYLISALTVCVLLNFAQAGRLRKVVSEDDYEIDEDATTTVRPVDILEVKRTHRVSEDNDVVKPYNSNKDDVVNRLPDWDDIFGTRSTIIDVVTRKPRRHSTTPDVARDVNLISSKVLKLKSRSDHESNDDDDLKGPVDPVTLSPEFIRRYDPNFKLDDDIGDVDPETLSPEFIKKYDPNYKPDDIDDEGKWLSRSLKKQCCLKDSHVTGMACCLAKKFKNKKLAKAYAKNHLRRFLHTKNVKAWFSYLNNSFQIKLNPGNMVKIVKCYIDQIPT